MAINMNLTMNLLGPSQDSIPDTVVYRRVEILAKFLESFALMGFGIFGVVWSVHGMRLEMMFDGEKNLVGIAAVIVSNVLNLVKLKFFTSDDFIVLTVDTKEEIIRGYFLSCKNF
jgi:Co/Zn/Cd efflux system component